MSRHSLAEREPLLSRNGPPLLSDESSASSTSTLLYPNVLKSVDALKQNEVAVLLDRSPEADVIPETTSLGRNLGWSSCYVLIISRVIGSGIFATPGAITKSVGSVGLSLLLWVVGGLIAWFGLQISLEYGSMLPRSGGDKVYLEFTYQHPKYLATTMVAVQAVLLGFTASNAIIFGEYVLFAWGKGSDPFIEKTLAVGLLTSVIIVHGCFRRTGILIQNVLGFVKLGLIVFMVLTSSFVVVFRTRERAEVVPLEPKVSAMDYFWRGSVWDWGTISTALFKVFYSYAGLQNVNSVMNEVKDPVRTLKSAATSALGTALVLFTLVNVAYFLIVPLDEIKHSGELIAALFFEKVFGAGLGKIILPLAVAVSAIGNVMVVTFAHARVNQEIARQGFLPFSRLLSSSKPFNSPLGGLIVLFIPSFLVITLPAKNVYSFILEVEGYPGQFFALATSFGLIWLRRKRPDLRRPYKAFLPAVWLRILLSLALIAAPLIPKRGATLGEHFIQIRYALVGLAIFAFGLIYWYLWSIILPRWGKYTLKEQVEVLDDGTTITRFVRVNNLTLDNALEGRNY